MAAGLGFKNFSSGEVLTAADVNGYLMQGVGVFTDAANRDAEITSPQEGQFAYLKDTNVTTYYTGSAWANLDTTGMTNPMTTTGDTIYSSSGSTPARLGIGSTGQVLTVAGGVPTWAAPASGGGMTVIASGSLSGSSVNLSSIPSTYINLQLVVKDFNFSTAAILVTRCNTISSGYWGTRLRNLAGTATLSTAGTNQLGITQDLFATNADNIQVINIYDYASTDARKLAFTQAFAFTDTNDDIGFATFQKIETTSAITSIQIEASAGTFSAGNYILYGVK